MATPQSNTPSVGLHIQPIRASVIRCTCAAEGRDARETHGVDLDGKLNPCPRGRIEYLGELDAMTRMVERYGCTSLDEFKDRHPWRWRLYQARVIREEIAAGNFMAGFRRARF